MFVGHYAAAFAAKAAKPDLPLWHLFVAAQLVDFAWAGLILAGVEQLRITPGYMEASPLELLHMPWTHSLAASLLWALGAGLLYWALVKQPQIKRAAVLVGLVVLSHWVLDLFVHAPDLALWPGGPKVGFALWESLLWSQVLEIGLLAISVILYARFTPGGWFVPILLFVVLCSLQYVNHMPAEETPTVQNFAVMALVGFSFLVVAAWVGERWRQEPAAA